MYRFGAQLSLWLRPFAENKDGAASIIFAFSMIALLGVAGSAVDYSVATMRKAKLQEALDAATLAGVSDFGSAQELSGVVGGLTNEQRIQIASNFFDSNKAGLPNVDNVSFQYEAENLVGRASIKVNTFLLRVLGFQQFDVNIISSTTRAPVRAPLCFMAMHPTRKHTLELNGAVSVMAPDCNIYGNSDNFDDVVDPHNPENYLTGKSVQAVGYGHHYLANVTPPLEHAPELIADPLASLVLPAAAACDFNGVVISATVTTLNPGTYCGGLEITNAAVVTLNPGLYVISTGRFVVSNAEIGGTEVTVALADASVEIDLENSKLRWSAPKSGQYTGMALIGTRDPVDHIFKESTLDLHGVIYLLQGSIVWTNVGTPVIDALWSAWIVDGISWDGDGTITYNFNLAASDVPYPVALNVIPRPGRPRLVK